MHTRHLIAASLLILCATACERAVPTPAPPPAPVTDDFATVPNSAWIDVNDHTLIGLYPVVSSEQLDKDEGLATALDDFSFHLGTAQDSLRGPPASRCNSAAAIRSGCAPAPCPA